jgi:hypothetical protein
MKTQTIANLAAMGIALLASPVAAQTWQRTSAPLPENNVFWGLENAPPQGHTYGSNVRPRAGSLPRGAIVAPGTADATGPRVIDCVHVTFPQCGGGGQ